MKPHKHAELIKAWADGAEIQRKSKLSSPDIEPLWQDICHPNWNDEYVEYRIKPESKPDVVLYGYAEKSKCEWYATKMGRHQSGDNLKLTFDGETGELKSAEVLK